MANSFAATSDSAGTLRLLGDLDIYAAGEIVAALKDALQSMPQLDLDLSGIDACDTAGVQILCAARKTAEAAGKPFRIVAVSSAVEHVCGGIGLTPVVL